MSEQERELLYDLLIKKAIYGLDEQEESQLAAFDPEIVEKEFLSLEMTAAAISMASIEVEEMPAHLMQEIADAVPANLRPQVAEVSEDARPVRAVEPVRERRAPMFQWLGWAFAGMLLVVLSFDLYYDRIEAPREQAKLATPTPTPAAPDPGRERDELLHSAPDLVKANWAAGNVKELAVAGDIVWSDAKQEGYMRFKGLPPNQPGKASYQLWIFDETQDKATPIDGGVFDVGENGEVIVPIRAKLRASHPALFAVTIEKPGGVVVSKREKIAALAKIESPST